MHYKEKCWLESEYATKSTYEIANAEKVSSETIRKWLKKFGIERRDAITLNYLTGGPDLVEFMTGSMLGDGSISWGHEGISAYYSTGSSRPEYLNWVEQKLKSLGITIRGKINFSPRGGYKYWHLHSKYYRNVFPELRETWYPGGKKAFPSNTELTRSSLLLFYLDDGSLTQSTLCLATNNFSIEDARSIKNEISRLIGNADRIYVRDNGSGPCIWIYKKSILKDFFDFIGPCPQELESIFGHKWL